MPVPDTGRALPADVDVVGGSGPCGVNGRRQRQAYVVTGSFEHEQAVARAAAGEYVGPGLAHAEGAYGRDGTPSGGMLLLINDLDRRSNAMTSNTVTTERPLTRDEAGALFSRAMGLVAVTAATFALGAYLARDVTAG